MLPKNEVAERVVTKKALVAMESATDSSMENSSGGQASSEPATAISAASETAVI